MNAMAKFVVEHARLAWTLALVMIAVLAISAGAFNRDIREQQRLSQLETEAERSAIDVMSQTLNGNLMGSVAALGLIDQDIKREAKGQGGKPNTTGVVGTLESVGRSYDAEGVFIVAADGVIKSSWDNAGKPSTGLNVKFRPYYQMSMQGSPNVYAAVSLARGDRSLYFSVPVYLETTNATEAIGAVVARTGLASVDDALRNKADIALLLSPQGVVFASNRKEWIGFLAGQPAPERLKAIRDLKQFGNMFQKAEPSVLPFAAVAGRHTWDGRHYAVATSPVKWNDVSGDWQLVLMEDLSRSVPPAERYWVMGISFSVLLGIAALILMMLRGQYAQMQAALRLQQFATEQERSATSKARLAAASVKFQQASDLPNLGQVFLREVHEIFGALQAVFYVVDTSDDAGVNGANDVAGEGSMSLVASYACSELPPDKIVPGEGMLGQCAIERRVMTVHLPSDENLRIRSGLGDMRPRSVMLLPVLLNDRLLGIVELALPAAPGATEQDALEELARLLAMNIEIVSRSAHTEEVLSATRAAEQANAEQLAFQQALVDTIPYPVFYKGADARFLGFNRAYEHCFGVQRENLIGKRVIDLDYLPEADRIAYQAEDEAVIASGDTIKHEMSIPFADGKLHDTLYFVSGFRRPDGSPGGLVGTFIDITEMKRAQDELARLADADRFNRLAQGREARILQLKQEVNTLCQRLAESPRYGSADADTLPDTPPDEMQDLPLGEHLKLVHLNWHPAYDSGQADIDREHHTLFAIANDLLNAIVAGKSSEDIGHIIDQLVQETVQHFTHEEAILAAHGYADLEAHRAIHRSLIDQAVHLIDEFKAGKVEAGPFFQFLAYDVIARHMLGADRKFFHLFEGETTTATTAAAEKTAIPSLAELVDLDELQRLFAAFCESVGIAAAIIDLDAKVLASSRWQRACTDFHRVNPDSCARCIESDTQLALKLQDGQDYTMYKCKNGMTDCASPIILEGQHLANVFIGQFHLGPPDMEFFRQQARQFGYPEAEYLQAIADAPVADEKRLPVILGFLSGFARLVSTMSLARYRGDLAQKRLQQQAEQLHRERIAALSLAEDAEQTRIALAAITKESQV